LVGYRIERVDSGGEPSSADSRSRANREVEVDVRILSHDLIDPKDLPADWFELAAPTGRPWAARQSFNPTQTVGWPPIGSTGTDSRAVTEASQVIPPVYDLGASFRLGEALVTGAYLAPAPPGEDATSGKMTVGTPPAVLEVLHPAPSPTAALDGGALRAVVEYSEVTSAGAAPTWPSGNASESDNVGYSQLIWVVTLPPGSSAWGVAEGDYVLVDKPDATVIVEAAPGTKLSKVALQEAAKHLRRRQ